MKTVNMKIEGMSCGHCVTSVEQELKKLSGVRVEDVQIGSARVSYDDTKVAYDDLARAVQEAGYALQENS